MPQRRYELAPLAAAIALRSGYCCLAHGRLMAEQLGEPVTDIVRDRYSAGLSDEDVAVMELAEQVARDATGVTPAQRARLVDLGLSDHDGDMIVLAAAARSFFSTALDGLGVLPDPEYSAPHPALRGPLPAERALKGFEPSHQRWLSRRRRSDTVRLGLRRLSLHSRFRVWWKMARLA